MMEFFLVLIGHYKFHHKSNNLSSHLNDVPNRKIIHDRKFND